MDLEPYHETEIALQERSGRRALAQALAPRISDELNTDVAELLSSLPFIVVATIDQKGSPWASILTQQEGFISTTGQTGVRIRTTPDLHDPLRRNLERGGDIGLIAIDLSRRYRYRINGTATLTNDGIKMDVAQCYQNCPQFIHARRASYDSTRYASDVQPSSTRTTFLTEEATTLLNKADTFFIATHGTGSPFTDPKLGADVSHRGGNPGFVTIAADGKRLSFPDYIGNFMFNTLGNLKRHPKCGLLFIDFESGATLQLSGTTEVDWDLERAATVPGAQRIIDFEVQEVIYTHNALPLAWTLIELAPDLRRFKASGVKGQLSADAGVAAVDNDDFRNFVVSKIVHEADDIRSIYLRPLDGRAKPFLPGQYLPVKLFIPGEDRPVIRHYSLSHYEPRPSEYRIGVRRMSSETGVSGSNYLHDHIEVGSKLLVGSPSGTFTLGTDTTRPVALVGAGIGITPLLSMYQALMAEKFSKPLWFIHGARNGAAQAYGSEIRLLSDRLPNVNAHFRYSKSRFDQFLDFPLRDYDSEGRVDAELVKSLITKDAEVYICGPSDFMSDLRRDLEDWGIPKQRIYVESFGSGSRKTAAHSVGKADVTVTFADAGMAPKWSDECSSILDLAEGNGLTLPFSCRTGDCGTCEHLLAAGEVDYPVRPLYEPKPGHVLVCCAQPTTDVVIANPKLPQAIQRKSSEVSLPSDSATSSHP